MGVGLGSLVDKTQNGASAACRYLDFVAPGLLAAAAMQTAATESTWPVIGAIRWTRTYHAMIATPLAVARRRSSAMLFVVTRVPSRPPSTSRSSRLSVRSSSWLGLLAVPVAVLLGPAFAMPMAALAATVEDEPQLRHDLPLPDHADVPLLGHVLPGHTAAARLRADRIRHADLARRRAVPDAHARRRRACSRRSVTSAYLLTWTIVGCRARAPCVSQRRLLG